MTYLTVSQLTQYLKRKFDRDPYLEKVYLVGEVSNFRPSRSGHQYFALKDGKTAKINVVMWEGNYKRLPFQLEEGMRVFVEGRISLYAPNGSYSITITTVKSDGIGDLTVQLEQLTKRLREEGLFKPEFKQALPRFVKKIGVVTAPSGAVIHDIIKTTQLRYPGVAICLYPVRVQGQGAAPEIAAAIQQANQNSDLDVLIVGRGGGSIEDLWAFNEEVLVRAVFESKLPVISSVGHETDTTLVDYVADQRASTPTQAVEYAIPVTKAELVSHLAQTSQRVLNGIVRIVNDKTSHYEHLAKAAVFRQPDRLYGHYIQETDHLTHRLQQGVDRLHQVASHRYQSLSQRLLAQNLDQVLPYYERQLEQVSDRLQSAMQHLYEQKLADATTASQGLLLIDPGKIVARGFAMLKQEGKIIQSVQGVKAGQLLDVQLSDGHLEVVVESIHQD